MKKYSDKHVRHLLKKSKREIRRRTLANVRAKQRKRRGKSIKSSNSERPFFVDIPNAPEIFRLNHDNCESVLSYIDSMKRAAAAGNHLNINLSQVKEIGEGAISMLLTVIEEIADMDLMIKGQKPDETVPRDVLERSGFFDFVNGKVDEKNKDSKNTILTTGDITTPQDFLVEPIRSANETVWGERGRNPLVYGVTYEMVRNSCDHAFKNQQNVKWHLAISHNEDQNLVKFSFVDNGEGILKTFRNGLLKKLLALFEDDVDILDTAFKDGIKSRTGLSWRGKGLPTIYENYEDNYIKNLLVISNDVYMHFDGNGNIQRKLSVPFSGTYYYFEIDQSCEKACFQ